MISRRNIYNGNVHLKESSEKSAPSVLPQLAAAVTEVFRTGARENSKRMQPSLYFQKRRTQTIYAC